MVATESIYPVHIDHIEDRQGDIRAHVGAIEKLADAVEKRAREDRQSASTNRRRAIGLYVFLLLALISAEFSKVGSAAERDWVFIKDTDPVEGREIIVAGTAARV